MQILQISLYSKSGERRDVQLKTGSVNIITGASKRGKTSLIDIVEYCLGSSKCGVAHGRIWETVQAYGLLLQFSDSQLFIARKAPLLGYESSTSACMIVGTIVHVPDNKDLSFDTNIDGITSFLTRKLGVPENVTEVPEGQTRDSIQLGFNHTKYYLFQRQNEIANDHVLFHKQSEPFVPQAIKDTLPYFLGAADEERISDLQKLRELKKNRNDTKRKLTEIESLKGNGLERGYQLYSEAVSVGLHEKSDSIPDEENLLSALKQVRSWQPQSEKAPNENEIHEINNLESQYKRLRADKIIVNVRIKEAEDFSGSQTGYKNEVDQQNQRLQSIGLFQKIAPDNSICPVCEHEFHGTSKYTEIIKNSLRDIDKKLAGVERQKPRISAYQESLKAEQIRLSQQLKITRTSLDNLFSMAPNYDEIRSLDLRKAVTVGRISLYLDSINWHVDTSALNKKLSMLDSEIIELESKLDPSMLKDRLDSQLNFIGRDMSKWAQELKLEHSQFPIRLDISKLTVIADTPDGPIPLYRMGSGETGLAIIF